MNEWAVTNDIIIMYPHADPGIRNFFLCWDTGLGAFPSWSSSRDDFTNKQGIQIKAVKKMIDRLYEPRDTSLHVYSRDGNLLDRN